MKIHPDAEQELRDLELDDEELAHIEHVLGDDRPPQGLHRQGYRERDDE